MQWSSFQRFAPYGMLLGCTVMTQMVMADSSATTLATPQPMSAEACASIAISAERLACYDSMFKIVAEDKSTVVLAQQAAPIAVTEADNFTEKLKQKASNIFATEADSLSPHSSLLDSRWELSTSSKLGTWNIRAYQPVYLMPVFWTSHKNTRPISENPENTVSAAEGKRLTSTEAKFQLSLKTKAVENLFGDNGDVWLGYTQSSRWQVYNEDESRPFRETNYEPEASLVLRTNYNLLGLNWRMMGLTFNHQSNGRSDPWSRSWNRIMLNLGFDYGNFAVMIRPWYRLSEDSADDNNPQIKNYIGRGDLQAFYRWNEHDFNLLLRHSLKGGDDNRGAVRFDWTFPISGRLRGNVQLFDGFGESLIDYNHRATYIGVGVSMLNWY